MYIRNIETKEQYFLFLYESWWHYPLLGFTWFLEHNAYLIKDAKGSVKSTKISGLGVGLVLVLSMIIGNFIQEISIYKIPEQYYWIGEYLTYPLVVISIILIWKYMLSHAIGLKDLDKEQVVRVKINYKSSKIFSFLLKLVGSFALIAVIGESIRLDIITFALILVSMYILLILVIFFAGASTIMQSKDGRRFMIDIDL